jgi:flagellar hook-length control protein FliK
MLDNQPPLQATRAAQSPVSNQLAAGTKPDEGQQSFEAKLSEHMDSDANSKKRLKASDEPETSEPALTVAEGSTATPQAQAASIRDATVMNFVNLAVRQQGELPSRPKTSSDGGAANLGENDFEVKSSKLSSLEGADTRLIHDGSDGSGGSRSATTAFGIAEAISGAGVSTHTLMLSKMADDLSTKNSPPIVEIQLSTPFGNPHFESSFATQISFLTNQGITHAKIHLNPQEMGPVSVDIHSVGDKIEVNFQAAREQTRQAIEASIDTLRGLMRDEGMTLQNAVVRSIEITSPQAMSASSEQRSNDFQFDRASQFDGFTKNFHQNTRDQRHLNNQSLNEVDRTDTALELPSVGGNGAVILKRLTGIDLFA